jgi:predicted phosphate transport protein (TIGR00153 family)
MNFFKQFISRGEDFYALLYSQSQKTLEGITALYEFMATGDKETGQKVLTIEDEADELRRILIDCLDKSLVTPIDREDIFRLSGEIDDIIDYARTTIEEMDIYELAPNEALKQMVQVLLEATKYINTGMKHLKEHKTIAGENAVRAKKLENELETLYRIKLKELVQHEDFGFVFKMREVYRHISNLADKVDMAANTIEHIIFKAV